MKTKLTECKHNWKMQSTQYQYISPGAYGGYSSTLAAEEVAYLLCDKCLIVKKVKVQQ